MTQHRPMQGGTYRDVQYSATTQTTNREDGECSVKHCPVEAVVLESGVGF